MILCVTLNPCVDRTLFVDKLDLDRIIAARRSKCIPGGKGNNVARVLRTLGLPVDSFVLLGGHTGRLIEETIRQQDGITPFVFWTQGPTREVITVVEEGSNRQVAFKEPGADLTPSECRDLALMLRILVAQYEWVVFSGSVPCPELDHTYHDLIHAVRRAGGKAVLDSSGKALARGLSARPYLFKANLEEAAYVFGKPVAREEDIWTCALSLSPKETPQTEGFCADVVAVTAGKQGAYVVHGGDRWRALPPAVPAVNPVGSGDSFLGGLIAGLAQGASFDDSLRLAVAAGAANAARWDAATFTRADVENIAPQVQVRRLSEQQ